MSATIEAEQLSTFFGGAPVITVPGRTYPVTRSTEPASYLEDAVVRLATAGRNVLVFQPGKKEINETVDRLCIRLGGQADVLPLHGEIDPADQMRCFAPPRGGRVKVVVATNVAQTSVTIPDIDAVVDSGMERRIELRDGIEGLHLLPISLADCDQRAGRAGRTKPGMYVLASDAEDRSKFPCAEILRTRLDQMVLRLACQGFDATALRFFHQPDSEALAIAKQSLITLGAMSEDGEVTRIGHKMSRLPLAVTLARMLVEAERLGVVEPVATVAACMEAGNILARDGSWARLTTERSSDLLAVLDVFRAGRAAILAPGSRVPKSEKLRELGIFTKDFFRACDLRSKILGTVPPSKVTAPKVTERAAILQACVAGLIDHIYVGGYGGYTNGDAGVARVLAKESVVRDAPKMIVGVPFDISGKDKRGRSFQLRLVGMASAVDGALIERVAPHLIKTVTGKSPYYDPKRDCIRASTERVLAGSVIDSTAVDAPDHPEGPALFAQWLCQAVYSSYTDVPAKIADVILANRATLRQIRDLYWSTPGKLPFTSEHEVTTWFLGQLPPGCASVAALPDPNVLLITVGDLEDRMAFHQWKALQRVPPYDPRTTEVIPDILVEAYTHNKDGEPVYAYGALERCWGGVGEVRWLLSRAEAETMHNSYIEALKEQREMDAAMDRRTALHEKAAEVRQTREYYNADYLLRQKLDDVLYQRAYTKEEAYQQISKIEAILNELKETPVSAGPLNLSGLASLGVVREKRVTRENKRK